MMGKISVDQSHQVMATLAINANWKEIDFEEADLQNRIIRNPKEAGRLFTEFLKGNIVTSFGWDAEKGVIYFSVTSDGTTGEEWIKRLESKGFNVSDYAKNLLLSKEFKPTSGIITNVAVLKGRFFADEDRITKKIRAEADNRKWGKSNPEIACLIREKFTDEDIEAMGLIWIIVMHEPINNSDGDPRLLVASRSGDGCWLDACYGDPGSRWDRGDGFAFVVSQVSIT